MGRKLDHEKSIMTAGPILSRWQPRPEAGHGTDVGRALGRVIAEIDDIVVSALKSITLTTLRRASLKAEAAAIFSETWY